MKAYGVTLILAILWAVPSTWASPGTPPAPRRNPFRPPTTPTPHMSHDKRPPLEQYPLSALTLTAIVTNMEGSLFASVEIPSGIGFKVVRGTTLGENGARVIEISKSGILIEERVDGEVLQREIRLRSDP
jgi:Tfp pilus assembly protein PilP